jgi:hypothetical protein
VVRGEEVKGAGRAGVRGCGDAGGLPRPTARSQLSRTSPRLVNALVGTQGPACARVRWTTASGPDDPHRFTAGDAARRLLHPPPATRHHSHRHPGGRARGCGLASPRPGSSTAVLLANVERADGSIWYWPRDCPSSSFRQTVMRWIKFHRLCRSFFFVIRFCYKGWLILRSTSWPTSRPSRLQSPGCEARPTSASSRIMHFLM